MQYSEAGVIGGSSLENVVRDYASALDDNLAARLDTCLTATMDVRSREVLGGLLDLDRWVRFDRSIQIYEPRS